jgi:[ribosomal protein S18]-alanine N-acetyltransferase
MGVEGKVVRRSEWKIRFLRPEDVAVFAEILRESPEAANWSEASFCASIASVGGVGLVCESGVGLMGFLLGRQIVDQGEILNLAVRAASRGQGVGSELVKAVLDEFRKRGVCRVHLEVRASNLRAIGLYRAQGFVRRGIREGYYRNPVEAAVLLEIDLISQN